MSSASEYFKALCGPESKFIESERTAIELHDDDPTAVETLLRHIYDFSYADVQIQLGAFNVDTHMSVVVAARKYFLSRLESDALGGLRAAINAIDSDCKTNGGADGVLDAIELLARHRDHNPTFKDMITLLTQRHMVELFKLERFRSSLETDEG